MSVSSSSSSKKDEVKQEDNLFYTGHPKILKMLTKYNADSEQIYFSDKVTKINRKGKPQERAMLITDRAVYNIKPKSFECKRRIPLESIFTVTMSNTSNEFVIHVEEEYDYRYDSGQKEAIVHTIKGLHDRLVSADDKENKRAKMFISNVDNAVLKDVVLIKPMAALQSREERIKRKQEMLAQVHESDNEEETDASTESNDTVSEDLSDFLPKNAMKEKVGVKDFRFLKVLGRGAFGKVMLAKKKDTGDVFAVKILKKRDIVVKNQVANTRAERDILMSLEHPFLMRLRFAFQTKEKLYFVLDYLPGGELFYHLKAKRRFDEQTARIYVAEVALALGHLHSMNIVYRDIKPENILLDKDGHCCITDFGLSKAMTDDEKAQTFCGTPEYLAPEIIIQAGNQGYGLAVDWWSLGILLYELTVGIPPFYSQNVNQMYDKIRRGVLRLPSNMSEDCKGLIIGLLVRDPAKRLGSQNDVEDIKQHPFFKDIDWDKLMRKEINPTYKPKVSNDVANPINFDEAFTSEQAVDTFVPTTALTEDGTEQFDGFTFQEKKTALNDDDDED